MEYKNKVTIVDFEAAEFAAQAYERNLPEIVVHNIDGSKVTWNIIETIHDKDTGLHGYVIAHPETNDIVIAFEGTNMNEGFDQKAKDIREDIEGIIFGDSNYPIKEVPKNYNGSPAQDASLVAGNAKIKNGKYIELTKKNQFTEADPIVKKYVKKYGSENITVVGHSLGGALAEFFAVKYNLNAITFAAADAYSLLSEENKKRVDRGEFKSKIISYTYPDDIVGTYYRHSIGSIYYMSDPISRTSKGLSNHGIINFTDKNLFDESGYFIPDVLYDETLKGTLTKSPLALKHQGVSDFHIVIKGEILAELALRMKRSEMLIENTGQALKGFNNFYEQLIIDLKKEYKGRVQHGQFDKLTYIHVDEVFNELGLWRNGSVYIVNEERLDKMLNDIYDVVEDTGEIAYHMERMGDEFERTDRMLADWFGLK